MTILQPLFQKLRTNSTFFFLPVILIGSVIIRFYQLDQVPISLYWDEIAAAYNAYSIQMTGKDEYGTFFPLLFRSFDDYKMPIYIYLTSFSIAIFGLNEFAARFVSAFSGVVAVGLTFFLTRSLLDRSHPTSKGTFAKFVQYKDATALIAAFLLAISPWHIQFSRAGFEGNLALTFVLAGIYFFLQSKKKIFFFYVSLTFFALSFYTYRSIFLFVPILLLGMIYLFRHDFFPKHTRIVLLSVALFFFSIAPITHAIFFGDGNTRANQVSIFTNSQDKIMSAVIKRHETGNTVVSQLFYNKWSTYGKIFMRQYISHFSPSYLFFHGDGNSRHSISGMGLFYLWELPFLIIGLIVIILSKSKIKPLLLLWLFSVPLAASFSTPAPHALRSLIFLPLPHIMIAFGIITATIYIPKYSRIFFLTILGGCLLLSFFLFTKKYHHHNTVYAASDWADGYKQLVHVVKKEQQNYNRVIITGQYWQPYVYFLFYTHYDPAVYQEHESSITFSKYYFGGTAWDQDKGREGLGTTDLHQLSNNTKTLVILSPEEYDLQKENLIHKYDIKNHAEKTMFILSELK